jgi:hypothetical protein
MANNSTINTNTNPNIPAPQPAQSWRDKGFGNSLTRTPSGQPKTKFIRGADFDALLDEMNINRILRLKNLPNQPQGNEPAKMYWDSVNKKFKIWVSAVGKWADVVMTTTSTSTTSTSTSTT